MRFLHAAFAAYAATLAAKAATAATCATCQPAAATATGFLCGHVSTVPRMDRATLLLWRGRGRLLQAHRPRILKCTQKSELGSLRLLALSRAR